jgi:hypothetical protein
MKRIKVTAFLVELLAGIAGVISIWNLIAEILRCGTHLSPYNAGYGLANEALAFVGLLAFVVAKCLRRMEARLSRLERSQSPLRT